MRRAFKKVRMEPISKEKIINEIVTNGVAWILSAIVSVLLHRFFVTPSWRNLGGLIKPKNKIMVDKETFGFINWLIIFIVGLFVFTVVERLMEEYLSERKRK